MKKFILQVLAVQSSRVLLARFYAAPKWAIIQYKMD